jgi:hypothetical protein
MDRQRLTFNEFMRDYQSRPTAFLAVNAKLATDEHDRPRKVLQMDIICTHKLAANTVRFVEVPFDTKEQYDDLIAYLKWAAETARDWFLDDIESLASDYLNPFWGKH